MKPLLTRIPIVLGMVIVGLIALYFCYYLLLWTPSLQGKCGSLPPKTLPHVARFRGQVVGKNLWLVQYRWLRRRFKAVGTTVSLFRQLPSTIYKGNLIRHDERIGDLVIDNSGRFDFGDLTPSEYEARVTFPGEGTVLFGFVIDPSAQSSDVLIDASPAYYCNCCGWNFEPH